MTSVAVYGFGERLAMSEGAMVCADVETILLKNIPGAYRVSKATESEDRSGTDWWVECVAGRALSVDCKVREDDWATKNPPCDDLALETWSVIEQKIPGWTRNPEKRTDYILWLWKQTGRWCLVPFPMLCAVFRDNWTDWRGKYSHARQRTPGRDGRKDYHSECIFAPRRDVWAAIYKQYGGQPKQGA